MAKARRSTTDTGEAPAQAAEPAAPLEDEATPVSEVEPSVPEDDETPAEAEAEDAALKDTTDYLKGLVESLLFVADHPVDLKELARAARIDRKRTQEILMILRDEYEARGIFIDEVAEGFAFRSNPRYSSYVRNFLAQRPVRLSRAQLETLAIIAYRQPITRPEVDDIRGVDCGPVLKGLLERDLVKILGKKDEPGRPLLYGTTQNFLELFSMQSLSQLPTLREFTELSDESRRAFERQIGEEAPEGPVDLEAPAEASPESPDSTLGEETEQGVQELAAEKKKKKKEEEKKEEKKKEEKKKEEKKKEEDGDDEDGDDDDDDEDGDDDDDDDEDDEEGGDDDDEEEGDDDEDDEEDGDDEEDDEDEDDEDDDEDDEDDDDE